VQSEALVASPKRRFHYVKYFDIDSSTTHDAQLDAYYLIPNLGGNRLTNDGKTATKTTKLEGEGSQCSDVEEGELFIDARVF
jgi:hypothetical protein